jgi:hypothetical protein
LYLQHRAQIQAGHREKTRIKDGGREVDHNKPNVDEDRGKKEVKEC